ncbi:MAG: response regulator [Candidatus Moranbacteria bacterium]|nr:response regulator [Candidatus Moranbacteria bacterium]NTW46461.1 response regulator [Candidatus Moranbacteria bacterium]
MPTSRFAGKRILLVEDDFFVRDIYQRKLREQGFEVDTAADGSEGLQRLRATIPDLLLLDIFMPYVDGRDVLREMKADERLKNVPVILLTNFSASEGVRDGFDLGAEEYLIKSHFTPSNVLHKIESVLEKVGKGDILKDGAVPDVGTNG